MRTLIPILLFLAEIICLAHKTEAFQINYEVENGILRHEVGGVVFPLEMEFGNENNSEQVNHCSATVIQVPDPLFGTKCRVFTARHCFRKNPLSIKIKTVSQAIADDLYNTVTNFRYWWPFFGTEQIFQFKEISLKVKKVSKIYDLVELYSDQDLLSNICNKMHFKNVIPKTSPLDIENIQSTPTKSPQSSISYDGTVASLGFLNNKPKVTYSWDSAWPLYLHTSSLIEHFQISSFPEKYLYQIHDLDIYPGMSGGLSFIQKPSQVLGIQTQSVPVQGKAFVVPIETALNELDTKDSNANFLDEYSLVLQKNTTLPTGGNSHTDVDEAGLFSFEYFYQDPIGALTEPKEGYTDPAHPHQVILAMGKNQIDGKMDFEKFKSERPIVSRNLKDYLPLEIRKKILDRLKGEYLSPSHFNEGRRILFGQNNHNSGWTRTKRNILFSKLTLDEDKKMLSFKTNIQIHVDLQSTQINSFQSERIFDISFQNDYKILILRERGLANSNPLFCHNLHYLKLICRNELQSLSLSVSDTDRSQVFYRLIEFNSVPREGFTYEYGKLYSNEFLRNHPKTIVKFPYESK